MAGAAQRRRGGLIASAWGSAVRLFATWTHAGDTVTVISSLFDVLDLFFNAINRAFNINRRTADFCVVALARDRIRFAE